MEEADSLSLEIEENDLGNDLKDQIDQYNVYINFLNDYYRNPNPNPIKFDKSDLPLVQRHQSFETYELKHGLFQKYYDTPDMLLSPCSEMSPTVTMASKYLRHP